MRTALRYAPYSLLLALVLGTGSALGQTPVERVRSLELDSSRDGPTTVYFAPEDHARAAWLVERATAAAALFERELGLGVTFHMAVLSPAHWFSPYGGDDEPYGIPWAWNADALVTVPASLTEGVLIEGSDVRGNRAMVDFVALHELGHLATKELFHADSELDFGVPVRWFEEFLASYFAVAAAHAADPAWLVTIEERSTAAVESYDPAVRSLDWSFMQGLAGPDFARTYAWYQSMLNLAAADIHRRYGIEWLLAVKEGMDSDVGQWTHADVLAQLEQIAPEFDAWERRLSTP